MGLSYGIIFRRINPKRTLFAFLHFHDVRPLLFSSLKNYLFRDKIPSSSK